MIHADCGFFTSSPNHYQACGWRIADGYWTKRRRTERAEVRELKRTEKLLAEAAPAGHVRKIKPRELWLAGICARMYVRGALARYVDGDRAVNVEDMTARIIAARARYGYTDDDAAEASLAYARGYIHSPDPTPPPSPHPYGRTR